ncbi:MAG: hypothetical protein ACT4TC_17925 [Myxococcaceae bacterium]
MSPSSHCLACVLLFATLLTGCATGLRIRPEAPKKDQVSRTAMNAECVLHLNAVLAASLQKKEFSFAVQELTREEVLELGEQGRVMRLRVTRERSDQDTNGQVSHEFPAGQTYVLVSTDKGVQIESDQPPLSDTLRAKIVKQRSRVQDVDPIAEALKASTFRIGEEAPILAAAFKKTITDPGMEVLDVSLKLEEETPQSAFFLTALRLSVKKTGSMNGLELMLELKGRVELNKKTGRLAGSVVGETIALGPDRSVLGRGPIRIKVTTM